MVNLFSSVVVSAYVIEVSAPVGCNPSGALEICYWPQWMSVGYVCLIERHPKPVVRAEYFLCTCTSYVKVRWQGNLGIRLALAPYARQEPRSFSAPFSSAPSAVVVGKRCCTLDSPGRFVLCVVNLCGKCKGQECFSVITTER